MKEFKFLPHPKDICKWCNQILPELAVNLDDEAVVQRFKAYAGVSGEPADMMYMDDYYGEFKLVFPSADRHNFASLFASHILLQDQEWTHEYDPTWLSPLIIAGFFSPINDFTATGGIEEYDVDNSVFVTWQTIGWCCTRLYGEDYNISSPNWYLASWYSQIDKKISASVTSTQPNVYIKPVDNISNPFSRLPFIGIDNQSQWTNYVSPSILAVKGMDDQSFIKRHNLITNYLASFRRYDLTNLNNLKAYCLAYLQTIIWSRLNYIHRFNRIQSSKEYARIQSNGMRWRLIYDEKYNSTARAYMPRWAWDLLPTPFANQMSGSCPPLIANGSPVSCMRILSFETDPTRSLSEQIIPANVFATLGYLHVGVVISATLWNEIMDWLQDVVDSIPPSAALDTRGAGLWQLARDIPATPFIGKDDTGQTHDPKLNACVLSSENIPTDPFPREDDTFSRSGDVFAHRYIDDAGDAGIYKLGKLTVASAYIKDPRPSRNLEATLGLMTMRWLKSIPETDVEVRGSSAHVFKYSEVIL
jgi:hypothetical protein